MVIADFSLLIIILPPNSLIVTSKQPTVQFCVNYDYATVGNTAVIQLQQQVREIPSSLHAGLRLPIHFIPLTKSD